MFDSLRHHGLCRAPLSMGFSMQEYWTGLPCPPPGVLPNPGREPLSLKYGNTHLLRMGIRGIKKKKKKDLKVFALINWNDRENYRSEFCNISQELPVNHADFVMSATD